MSYGVAMFAQGGMGYGVGRRHFPQQLILLMAALSVANWVWGD